MSNNLILTGEVDEKMVDHVIRFMTKLKNDEPINVQLFTHGGDVYAGLAIYDLLKYCPNKVGIVCHGACMSAGTIILMAGDNRAAMKNTTFLVHYGSEYIDSGKTKKHSEDITRIIKEIYKEKTKLSMRTINRWLDSETYFDSKRALKSRLVDYVEEKY